MKRHITTEKWGTGHLGYLQQSFSHVEKDNLPVFLAGFMICAFTCYLFQAAAFSQTKVTASNAYGTTEAVGPSHTPEQEIAALKKEELELAETLMKDFPNSINPIMLMGNVWERHGDATRAMEYFNKVLEKDPERADVYKGIGWFYMNKQQYEQAIGYWKKVLEIDPNIPEIHKNIALALMGQNKQSRAIEQLEEEIKISPDSSLSYFLLGQLYLDQQEYEKAGDNYKKAIEIQPDYTNAYYGLFNLSARLKQQDKAKEYMAKFKKLKAEEMKVLKQQNEAVNDLIDMQKGAAETYLLAGRMYQAEKNSQKAEELFNRAMALDPNNVLCIERMASLYLTSNRITEAIALYRKISQINPKDPLCYLNIGLLSMRLNQLGNAEKAFRKVIEVAPESSGGYRELAQLYLRAGRGYPQARALAEKAVALEPTALNYFVLSWACDMNGDSKNALEAITKAMQLEPNNLRYKNVYEHIKNKK